VLQPAGDCLSLVCKQLPCPSMRTASALKSKLRGGSALAGAHQEKARVSVRFFGCFYRDRMRDSIRHLRSISAGHLRQLDAHHHSGGITLLSF
jgi:hypothetical protein